MAIEDRRAAASGGGPDWMLEAFRVLTWVVVTWVYEYISENPLSSHGRSVHLTVF